MKMQMRWLPSGKLADTVINGTMDEVHIETSAPLLNAGCTATAPPEKPFAVNEEEMRTLVDCARQNPTAK